MSILHLPEENTEEDYIITSSPNVLQEKKITKFLEIDMADDP